MGEILEVEREEEKQKSHCYCLSRTPTGVILSWFTRWQSHLQNQSAGFFSPIQWYTQRPSLPQTLWHHRKILTVVSLDLGPCTCCSMLYHRTTPLVREVLFYLNYEGIPHLKERKTTFRLTCHDCWISLLA